MIPKTVIPIIILLFLFPVIVLADSKSDYEYQYSKYREHFSEFSLFKKDYLSTPSLDNQQKALLTAKQTLNTRDLTKASFAAHIRDLILLNKLSYPPLIPVNQGLLEAQQFFLSESAKSLTIVTLADLNSFEESYSNSYQKYEISLKLGIVGQKVAKLKNFSLEQQKSLDILTQKLPSNISLRVTERISTLKSNLQIIGEKIDSEANYLISAEGIENTESEIFFSSKVDKLSEIRSLQLDWIDQLIDLDLNYGKI